LLRSDAAQEATLADAADYVPRLAAAGITLCTERRAGDIWAGAQARRPARGCAGQAAVGAWRVYSVCRRLSHHFFAVRCLECLRLAQ